MSFNKNRRRAIEERKAGAEKVKSRIRRETGDIAALEWSNLTPSGEQYRLTVTVGKTENTFLFSDESLSDYPTGHPATDAEVDAVVSWIKRQKS